MDNLFVSSTVGSKNKRENNIWWWCKMLQRIRKELFSTICRITMRWRTKCNGWQTMKSLINYITKNKISNTIQLELIFMKYYECNAARNVLIIFRHNKTDYK